MVAEISLRAIREEAGNYYLSGDYYCSEAVVAVIRKHFQADMPIESIAMASGFPIGVGGAMCICGAVPGGVLCIGYFFGRTAPKDAKVSKAMELSKELLLSFFTFVWDQKWDQDIFQYLLFLSGSAGQNGKQQKKGQWLR